MPFGTPFNIAESFLISLSHTQPTRHNPWFTPNMLGSLTHNFYQGEVVCLFALLHGWEHSDW